MPHSWRRIPAVDEARRPWAAVQVFVATAQSQVRPDRLEIERQGAGGVAEIPDHQRAVSVSPGGDLRHWPTLGGLVVDVSKHNGGGLIVDGRGQFVAGPQSQFDAVAQQGVHPLQDIEVGGEVAGLGQNHAAVRPQAQRPADELE